MKGIVALFITLCVFVTPLSSQAASPTLDQIEKSGKIRIGYRDSEPPMSFLDADGKPVGYSIDLCSRIVIGVKNKLEKEIRVEFVPVTAKDRFAALTENKIDIL